MKKSFVLHSDSLIVVDELSDEQAGKLLRKIKAYHDGVDYISDDKIVDIVFIQFKSQFDRDIESYKNVCERNKKNGIKGGRPKIKFNPENPLGILETQRNPLGILETQRNPEKPKKPDNDNDNDNESDSESESGSLGGSLQNLQKDKKREVGVSSGGPAGGVGSRQGKKFGSLAKEFELLAKKYPGSRPKHLAINEYTVARNNHTFDDIRKGIEMYSEYVSINGIDDKYIKGMKNFLAEQVYLEYKDMESKLIPGTKEHYKRFCKNMVGKEYESLLGFGKQKYSDQGYKRYLMIEYGMDEHTAVKLENQCNGSDEYFKSLLK